jgi:precorrin-4 methylase
MTKPIEEMRAWLEEARELAVKERGIFIMTKVEVIDAILAALAEKAELKVTEVFVREWAESIAGDSAINDIRRARGKVESLLRQAGVIILGHAQKEKAEPKGIIEELDSVLAGNKPHSAGGEDETNG